MIDKIIDDDGKIIAYCEWTICDKDGVIKKEGEFLYVFDLWCYKRNGSIPKLIKIIYNKIPDIKYVYWRNSKRDRFALYLKEQFKHKGENYGR